MLRVNAINRQELLKCLTFNPKSLVFKTVSVPMFFEAIEWPDLDVDLEIESLQHPECYPLVIKRNTLDFVGV